MLRVQQAGPHWARLSGACSQEAAAAAASGGGARRGRSAELGKLKGQAEAGAQRAHPTPPPYGPKHSVGSVRESGAQEKGKQTAPAGNIAQSGRPPERPPLRDVLRLGDVQLAHSAATQQDADGTLPDRRLLIFDVLGRRADGQLIRYRAMADTSSTGEFISPQAAKRGGFEIASGSFGHAVEAFGSITPLTQRAVGVQLTFNGELSGSGLPAVHSSSNDLTVAPLSGYDILLGRGY